MEILIPDRLSILGHPQRLALFRLLMRRFPDNVPAGEIAEALGIKASTLSTYLSALMQVGLITKTRVGTSLLYAIDMANVQQTFDYLLLDCCRGRPDVCSSLYAALSDPVAPVADRKFNVLFICTGNSARSIFAESILRQCAADRFNAYSAGTKPYSRMNPIALEVLRTKGLDISPLRAKNISEFIGPDAPRMDFVFTVCDQAANEDCPAWDGQPISGHWGISDPVKAQGSDAQRMLAFQQAYGALKNRIDAFTALPLHTLDRKALQHAVDDLGAENMDLT